MLEHKLNCSISKKITDIAKFNKLQGKFVYFYKIET